MRNLLFVFAILMASSDILAQEKLSVSYAPKGENMMKTTTSQLFLKGHLEVSPKMVTYMEVGGIVPLYWAPDGVEIRHVQQKLSPYYPTRMFFLVLLSNNETVQVEVKDPNTNFPWSVEKKLGVIPFVQYEYCQTIIGDDLYVMSDLAVYVSSDTPNHQVWTIDTAGLHINGAFLFFHDIDIDTTQKVWLATRSGLYSQLLGSPTWNKVTSYTSPIGFTGPDKVYIDRMQRIWLADGPYIFVSTDGGSSFHAAAANPTTPSTDFGDDIYGNVYVVKQGKAVYMSQGGTQPFVRVDLNILPDFAHFGANSTIYNDVTGDTVVHLSTAGGVYTSSNQGTSWTYPNLTPSLRSFSVASTVDNRLLMTTSTGFYRMETNGSWTKLFPAGNVHLGGMQAFTDAVGTIYHTGERAYSDPGGIEFKMVRKSTDNGNSFTVDTAGSFAAKVFMNIFFVDEAGVQHAAAVPFIAGQGPRPKVWKKEPGQPWTLDTAGLSYVSGLSSNAAFRCFGSDNAGNIYMAVLNTSNSTNYIYRRAQSGGAWAAHGTMGGSITEINGRAGKLVAANSNGAMYYNTGSWTIIPSPPSIPNAEVYTANVSSNGIVWAYYENFDANNKLVGRGVWYTTDMMTWKYPQPNVDTALFAKLVPIGDSLFALDGNFEGVYVFDTSTILSVAPTSALYNDLAITAVPNPFSDRTTLQFYLDRPSVVSLSVYDIKGSLVYKSPARKGNAGTNRVEIQTAPDMQPGLMIYRLQVDERSYKGKLIKQ